MKTFTYKLSLLAGVSVVPLLGGCRPSSTPLETTVTVHQAAHPAAKIGDISGVTTFDLGPVLAATQTINHSFTLHNNGGQKVSLLGATAFLPCCSSIGPLPPDIQPGGDARIPIILKTGGENGQRQISFEVETDSKTNPVVILSLSVHFFSEWEITPLGPSISSLPVGQEGALAFHVVCRRKTGAGRMLPDQIEAADALRAAFNGPKSEAVDANGITQAARDISVSIPASTKPGLHHTELVFKWPDGSTKSHLVQWQVVPRLYATPSGLVIGPTSNQDEFRTVIIASDGHPFRITKVSGPLRTDRLTLPPGSSTRQNLVMPLDATKMTRRNAFDIEVVTDHPGQQVVNLSVLMLPTTEGAIP